MRHIFTMGTAALALVMAAPAAATGVKQGIDAWTSGNFAQAVSIWRPLAEKGDADARFNLGQAYRLGRGVETDLGEAQRLFEAAARDGHLDAQAVLGLMLFNNGDRQAALRWLGRAARRGEPRALLVYGTALYNGEDVPRDVVRAYAYVSRAAAQGLAPAKTTLAEMDKLLPLETRKAGVDLARDLVADALGKDEVDEAPTKVAEAAKPKPAPPSPAPRATPAPAPKPAPASKPAPKPAPAPSPAPAAVTGWKIQLGAFSQRTSAEGLYAKVKGNAALSGTRMILEPAGKVTRLQVGPFADRAAAARACAAMEKAGQACFPVAP
ncbi:SPOR domain-containing protein [Sphingomicrobium nitratireducens]|uniref:SPOR domain-containing protein n=1 Tax=Sphingomicrobium nitratireducens TaxID=2964666 RepID=UPI00223FA9A6|nr:SPOR domain-containing protein [Sphingomicrobium nitratireducens]